MTSPAAHILESSLSASERELLDELFRALRTIRYGSLVLTVHDGRLVEIQKTEKIRKNALSKQDQMS